MKFISSFPILYKRDENNKIRTWEIQYGWDNHNVAGVRTISGLQEGKLTISEWNIKCGKNIGKKNATNAKTQSEFEAKSTWERRLEKEYSKDISSVDSYEIFKPMLAADYKNYPVSEGYSQPKLDGIRCIIKHDGMWTRGGKEINSCPHIWEALKGYFNVWPTAIIDGELYNHDLKADFNKITSLVRKLKSTEEDFKEAEKFVQYHVYDITWSRGLKMSFEGRYEILRTHLNYSKAIQLVETIWCSNQEELDSKYSEYTEKGYEGQIIRLDTDYENKRTKNLLKRKEFITEEFEVISVLEGAGNWSGYAKRFILKDLKGQEFGSGIRGKQDQMKELWENGKTPSWATCRYFNLTPDGIPRFPVVIDYGFEKRND